MNTTTVPRDEFSDGYSTVLCDRCGRGYMLDSAAVVAFESMALAALDDPHDEGHVCGICREAEFRTEVPR